MVKFAVGYPWSSAFILSDFAAHLPNLERPEGVDVKFFQGKGWSPARRHIDLCEQAVEWGAELICIIGADQIHPPDMLVKLYNRFLEGYDMVGAMVPARGFVEWVDMKAFQPMAWRFKTNSEVGSAKFRKYEGYKKSHDMLHAIKREDGDIVPCNFMGTGVLMFHVDYLLALKKPWFFETMNKENQEREACMDMKFVWRLQEEGMGKLWVDTTILVKHLHVFKIDDSFQYRFKDWHDGIKCDPPEGMLSETR